MANRLKILTALVLAAGVTGIGKVIAEEPEEAAEDILVLAKENADLNTVNEELVKEIENAGKTILMEAADGKPGGFEHDGKKYRFNFHTMQFGKEVIISEKIVADAGLQAELIASESCMISEIE